MKFVPLAYCFNDFPWLLNSEEINALKEIVEGHDEGSLPVVEVVEIHYENYSLHFVYLFHCQQ